MSFSWSSPPPLFPPRIQYLEQNQPILFHMYAKLSKTQIFQFRHRPAVPGTEWFVHRKKMHIPTVASGFQNLVCSAYIRCGRGTHIFLLFNWAKKRRICPLWRTNVNPAVSSWYLGYVWQETVGYNRTVPTASFPQARKQQFLQHPLRKRKKRKINSNSRVGLGSS